MKKLLIWLAFLLPYFAQAQFVNTPSQTNSTTRTVQTLNQTTSVKDTLAVIQKNSLANLDMLRWNSATLKWIPRTPAQVLSDIGAWGILGNTGLSASTNKLGTTDNIGLNIVTNNKLSLHIDSLGRATFSAKSAGFSPATFFPTYTMKADSNLVDLTLKTEYDNWTHIGNNNYISLMFQRENRIPGGSTYRPLVAGDLIGKIGVRGTKQSDGTLSSYGGGGMDIYADGTWSATSTPFRINFRTTSQGTTSTYQPLAMNNLTNYNANVNVSGDGILGYILRVVNTNSDLNDFFSVKATGVVAIPNAAAASMGTDSLEMRTSTGVIKRGAPNYYATAATPFTLAAIGSSANANGATLSAGILTLQPASGSFGGVLTAGTQTIAGTKNFSDAITATSFNKMTVTAPATASTITIADGKNFTASNTLTLTSADGSTLAIGGGGTLGSNAYTSTAYAPIASPTFTGTVTIPTPFTIGAVSMTSTAAQLNYLKDATGTTGTASGNLVFHNSPALVGTVTIGTSGTNSLSILRTSSGASATTLTLNNVATATSTGTQIDFNVSTNATIGGRLALVQTNTNSTSGNTGNRDLVASSYYGGALTEVARWNYLGMTIPGALIGSTATLTPTSSGSATVAGLKIIPSTSTHYIAAQAGNAWLAGRTSTGESFLTSNTDLFTATITAASSYIQQNAGALDWLSAPSVTAGSAIVPVHYFGVAANGVTTIDQLAGVGSRAVLADASGVLSAPVSDRSVKQNIRVAKYGIKEIMLMKPVTFEYISKYKNYGSGDQLGLIAQDLEKVIPEAVFTTSSTGLKGINYMQFDGIYIKALQDLQNEITELKALVAALKEVNKLK